MKNQREWSVAGVLGLLLIVLGLFAPAFFEPQPLLSRTAALVPALLVSIGVAMVMMTRDIDISVGSQFGICLVTAGSLAAAGLPGPLVVVLTILLGSMMGALNGLLVAGLRLPSIVVTLATMVTGQELLRLLQQGRFINLPPGWQWFGLSQSSGQWILISLGLGAVAAAAWIMRHVSLGRFILAVGSDAEAARISGIPAHQIRFGIFAFSGAVTALAALLHLVQSPQVDPNAGIGLELKAVAAAVVGGIAVSGGRGTPWGVLAGLALLGTVNPALTYLHVEAYWEKAIQGFVILTAVVTDRWKAKTRSLR